MLPNTNLKDKGAYIRLTKPDDDLASKTVATSPENQFAKQAQTTQKLAVDSTQGIPQTTRSPALLSLTV